MRNEIKKVLQAMADRRGGRLDAEEVVEAARDPESVLHEYFEWDADAAAESYRLHQARQLIRTVRIEVRTNKIVVQAPYFVRDPSKSGRTQGYVTTPVLRTNEDMARDALIDAFNRAARVLAGVRALAAVLGRSDEVDEMIQMLVSRAASAGDSTGTQQ